MLVHPSCIMHHASHMHRDGRGAQIVFTNLLVHDFCLTVTERNALAMRKNQTNTNKQVVEKLESLVQAQDYVLKTSASTLRAPVRCIVGESSTPGPHLS
jgi:hypothetical protein